MKTHLLLLIPATAIFSCSPTPAVDSRQVAAPGIAKGAAPSEYDVDLVFKEPGKAALHLSADKIKPKKQFTVSRQRELIYPSSYDPAITGNRGVIPATPNDFKSINTGFEANLTSERLGDHLVFKGTISITEFQGFAQMGGSLGRPIMDQQGRLVTENRIEMPKLATYTTPVYVAVSKGEKSTFEISHPSKRATVSISFSAQ